jgi:predicted MFS family arabinose efflux permease
MSLGLGGMAVGATIVAASGHLAQFAVGLFVMSLFKIVYDVGQGSWITDHVPFARRGRVVGLTETSWALGLLVGVSAMGLISSALSWSWAYLTGGVFAAVMAVVLWRRIGPDDVGHATSRRHGATRRARLGRAGWLVIASIAALAAASQSMFVTFGAWLEDDHGFTSTTLSAVTFVIGGVELLASSLSTARVDAWGKERSVVGGALVMIVAIAGFLATTGVVPVALAFLGVFIGSFEFSIVCIIPIGGELVPGRPGAGLSRALAASAIGRAVITIPVTAIFDRWGIRWCAVVAMVLAALITILMSSRQRLVSAGAAR